MAKDAAPASNLVVEYAVYLGLDPDKDADLLWIAEEAASAGAPVRTGFTAVLLPLSGRPTVLRLPFRADYLQQLCEALGGESLLPITLGSKGREAVGPRVFARVDPPRRAPRAR